MSEGQQTEAGKQPLDPHLSQPRDEAKERAEFGELAHGAESSVRAFLLSVVREPSVADDLLQDSLLIAWRHFDRYDRSLPFAPWLRGIASNVYLSHRRRIARRKVYSIDDQALAWLEQSVDQLVGLDREEWAERLQVLKDCRQTLTDKQREVIRQHYDEDLDCRTIGEQIGVQFEAVKKHLQRGRAALMRCLEERLGPLNSGGAS